MKISGMGVVSCAGRGLSLLEATVTQGWQAPQGVPPVFRVPPDALKDGALMRKIRRADRFTRMAVLSAHDAVEDAGLDATARSHMGIILSTAFGPHVTTFQFLDDILDFGEKEVSPTKFSHSVHNAAAFYVASTLGCRGPAITVTNFAFSFHHALILAKTWLASGRFRHVLVGAVDECHQVMEYICSRKLQLAEDGKVHAFDCAAEPQSVPGEGSAFFVLSHQAETEPYATISDIAWTRKSQQVPNGDLMLWDADGMAGDESEYRNLCSKTRLVGAFTPCLGSSLTVSALHCVIGALVLRRGACFPPPIEENPHGLNLAPQSKDPIPKDVSCIRINCNAEIGWVALRSVEP